MGVRMRLNLWDDVNAPVKSCTWHGAGVCKERSRWDSKMLSIAYTCKCLVLLLRKAHRGLLQPLTASPSWSHVAVEPLIY